MLATSDIRFPPVSFQGALRADILGAGAARRQVTFLASPRKANQKKATPPHRPCGLPSVFRKDRAAAELALRAQTVLADGPRSFRKTEAVQRGNRVVCAEG